MIERKVSEAQLQSSIIEAAGYGGWLHFHVSRSDLGRATPGFPDLVLVHPTRKELLFVELKSSKGKLRPEQVVWIDALKDVEFISVGVIRPADADELIARLVTRTYR